MALHLLSLVALLCCAAGDVNVVPLFTSYRGFPNCARQPLLVRTSRALLAFFEGRPGIFPTDTCSGTFYPSAPNFPIYALRSEDSGATWSSPANLTHGNLDFLVAVNDWRAGIVHLLVQSGDSGVIALESRDEGLRWSAPRAINISQPSGYSSLIPGVGHGLQIEGARCGAANPTCSGTVGRLVLPFVATRDGPVSNDTACGTCASALVISDDGGQSWALGAVSEQNGSREASIAQLDSTPGAPGAIIYASERNLGAHTGVRLHAVSTDGGATFDPARTGADASLPDVVTANWTGVVSGLTRFGSGGALAFSTPAAPGARANLSLWAGREDGAGGVAWAPAPARSLWAGPAAYSDLVELNSTHLGLVFEGGAVGSGDFAAGIFFAAFSFGGL